MQRSKGWHRGRQRPGITMGAPICMFCKDGHASAVKHGRSSNDVKGGV
jgi:hypothetical protein